MSSGLIANYLHSSPLTLDARGGNNAVATLESADAALIDDDVGRRICVQLHQTGAFLFACAKAAFALRTRSLERIIESIRRRKTLAMQSNAGFDCARSRQLVAVFNRLTAPRRPADPTSRRPTPVCSARSRSSSSWRCTTVIPPGCAESRSGHSARTSGCSRMAGCSTVPSSTSCGSHPYSLSSRKARHVSLHGVRME